MIEVKDRHQESLSLLKLVHAAILVGLLWKVIYFLAFDRVHQLYPLVDPFFPALFRAQDVARFAYAFSVGSSLMILFTQNMMRVRVLCCVSLLSLVVLSIHQYTYNDVTFMCCGWASIWCVWMSTRLDEPFESLFPRAVWLTHVILSLIFLGGAIGKLTPGYWSGDVLYEIYFRDRDFWTYNLLRSSLSPDGLHDAACWHSRMVLVGELLCGFLWLMPPRVGSTVAIVMLSGIALTNNVLLISVVASLLGLALVGLHQPRDRSKAFSREP